MNIYSYEFIEFVYNVNSIFYTRFCSFTCFKQFETYIKASASFILPSFYINSDKNTLFAGIDD